jgi:hypothetical protein
MKSVKSVKMEVKLSQAAEEEAQRREKVRLF